MDTGEQIAPTSFARARQVATTRAGTYTRRPTDPTSGTPEMEVQIFGIKKSADTRKAQRFFSERRVRTHFVDLQERELADGELQRFIQRFGVEELVDRTSPRYDELGMRHAQITSSRWIEKLIAEPTLLKLPLVRRLGGPLGLTVGLSEETWKSWLAAK